MLEEELRTEVHILERVGNYGTKEGEVLLTVTLFSAQSSLFWAKVVVTAR